MTKIEVSEFSLSALLSWSDNHCEEIISASSFILIPKLSQQTHPVLLPFHNNLICNLSYQFTKDNQSSVSMLTSLVTDSAI